MKPKLLTRGSEFWPSLGQLGGAHRKHVHLCLADDEPEILEEPADLVLNIPLDLDEQSSADKKGFDRMAIGAPLSRRASQVRRVGRLTRPTPRTSTPTASTTAPT